MKSYNSIITNMHYGILDAIHGDKAKTFKPVDVLVIMCAPIIHFESNDAKEWKKKILFTEIRKHLGSKFNNWRKYNYNSLCDLIRHSEWVKSLTEANVIEMLSEFPRTFDFATDNTITITEQAYNTYTKIRSNADPYSIIKYGDKQYVSTKKKTLSPKAYELEHPVTDNDMEKLEFYVEWSIQNWEYITYCEKYKWEEMICWEENFDLDSDDLTAMLKQAVKKHENLFDSSQNYHPMSDLYKLIACDKETVRSLLRVLFDETQDLRTRIIEYSEGINTLAKTHKISNSAKANYIDPRSISVMLMLNSPAKHYIYKKGVFLEFANVTGIDIPKFGSSAVEKIPSCNHYCDDMRERLLQFPELVRLNDKTYPDDKSNYHMMTQNFFYAIAVHYNIVQGMRDTTELLPYKKLLDKKAITKDEFNSQVKKLISLQNGNAN